jgi:transcriptional regulator GlxA family with amidase domain
MKISILAFQGTQLLDVVGPSDVFDQANRSLGRTPIPVYDIEVVGDTPDPIVSSSGLKLVPHRTIESPDIAIDTLLVAGKPGIAEAARQPEILSWLRRQAPKVRRLGSVCSGAFVLAAAGLLDGRRVTTHWNAARGLAARHPKVSVDPDRIWVRDGNIYTSAGVTAGMDLALAMVEEDFGRELALKIARQLVMFLKRPGGQSQFSTHLAAQVAQRSVIQDVQGWVLSNLAADNSVPALAKRAAMSERNFARVFRKEAGMTPAEFVESARIDSARRLIEETSSSLKEIAADVGFSDLNGMRRSFLRRLSMTPGEYRRRFRPNHSECIHEIQEHA